MNTSLFDLLNLRFQYEESVRNLEIPEVRKEGVINNLEWFKQNGHSKNRFRQGFNQAIEACEIILRSSRS